MTEELKRVFVPLWKPEREVIEWAASPMIDYWADAEERRAEGCEPVDEPVKVEKRGAFVMMYRGVLEDLKYRLLYQWPDVCDEQPNRSRLIASGERAWKCVSLIAAQNGIEDVLVPLYETLPDSE
jgi:hypothetical protein